ncbi:MAG: thiamine diphosphokinase [Anaerolineae bacterium]|nr:thiamine diphosphokinase [Anaerolineae bacterium]
MNASAKSVSKRVVILTNSPITDYSNIRPRLQAADAIICADGGANHLAALNLTPDLVIGDMDSVTPALQADLRQKGVRFEVFPVDKDETDLELAIRLAIDEGATEVEVITTLGGRMDQALANLLLLTRPEWTGVPLRAVSENEVAWLVREGGHTTIRGAAGDTVSLIPLSHHVTGLTFSGVKWPLTGATLTLGSTWTISNRLVNPEAHVQLKTGLLLVIHRPRAAGD